MAASQLDRFIEGQPLVFGMTFYGVALRISVPNSRMCESITSAYQALSFA
jgi:hypothetical protein